MWAHRAGKVARHDEAARSWSFGSGWALKKSGEAVGRRWPELERMRQRGLGSCDEARGGCCGFDGLRGAGWLV
jgi:hypothetical protein